MEIVSVLEKAEHGELEPCKECPWSPKKVKDIKEIAFGVSCTVHGLNWKKKSRVNSMLIVQDPGDTTPQKTGMLCAVHNAANPTDKTAQHDHDLWKATVSLDSYSAEAGGYMKSNYWTKAIMHCASKSSGRKNKKMKKMASQYCSEILALQILLLKPNIVVARGEVAVSSLYDIGLIKHRWHVLRHEFRKGAYKETAANWRGLKNITVFCTYHTSARVVNQTLSRQYQCNQKEIEKLIREKLEKLPNQKSVNCFFKKYNDTKNNARNKGMRYLLNHWLDIGVAIRASH